MKHQDNNTDKCLPQTFIFSPHHQQPRKKEQHMTIIRLSLREVINLNNMSELIHSIVLEKEENQHKLTL